MAAKSKQSYPPIILIAAIGEDRGLGREGALLYPISKDMEHFIRLTTGNTVVMGRKTWESLPKSYRPLPQRDNIVVTRERGYKAKGATVVHRFYEALDRAPKDKSIYIIGGGELYRQALSNADTLELTLVEANYPADAFFPEFSRYFVEESRTLPMVDETTSLRFSFVTYVKK